jgi:hypothetical protein
MHEHFGANAGEPPDATRRAYRIELLLNEVDEETCVRLMHGIADMLLEEGLGKPADAPDARAMLALDTQDWSTAHRDIAAALHIVVPAAVPRSPDLGAGYSPN